MLSIKIWKLWQHLTEGSCHYLVLEDWLLGLGWFGSEPLVGKREGGSRVIMYTLYWHNCTAQCTKYRPGCNAFAAFWGGGGRLLCCGHTELEAGHKEEERLTAFTSSLGHISAVHCCRHSACFKSCSQSRQRQKTGGEEGESDSCHIPASNRSKWK